MSIASVAPSNAPAPPPPATVPQITPPAPPTAGKIDTDGDHDGTGSAHSAGLVNVKA